MSHRPQALHCPAPVADAIFSDPQAGLDQVQAIYAAAIAHLRDKLAEFIAGTLPSGRVRACYPVVRVRIDSVVRPDSRLAYGFVAAPGVYETSLTRPELFADYIRAQFQLLLDNHGVALEIGVGEQPIPLHFSFAGQAHVELVGGFHQRALNLGELAQGVVIAGADAGGELDHALGHFRRDHAGQLAALQQAQQVGRAGHEVVVVPVDDLQLQLDADAQGA